MSIELKTCPFCGGRAVMKAVNKEYGFTIWCQCRKCGARTEGYCPDMNHEDNTITSIEECKDRAAKVWNNRAESANETAEGGGSLLMEKHEKENVCIDCKHYEACGKPERFMRCLGYEKAVKAERKDYDR